MAKFIKLTNTEESDIFINEEQIQTNTKEENDTDINYERNPRTNYSLNPIWWCGE